MNNVVLEATNIHFSYHPDEEILKGITFSAHESEMLGIIGPNGGGKSTLLKILVGLLKPSKGKVSISSNKMAYVPQTSKLNTTFPLTVKEYLELGNKCPESSLQESLEFVKMSKLKDSLVRELSGGQKQRVQLAKALLSDPKVLILDEPTNALDSDGQDQLLELIEKVKTQKNAAIIIVDHNINQILKYSDKILCLNRSYHWHNKKELLDKNTIESIYHCEFEHLKIHEDPDQGPSTPHHMCTHDHKEDK